MTRFWRNGESIIVSADSAGAPLRITWRGRQHVVRRLSRHWRLDTGWWHWRIWRDYFQVVTADGLLLIAYHDLASGGWYLERIYD